MRVMDGALTVDRDWLGSAVVVSASGEIDLTTEGTFRRELRAGCGMAGAGGIVVVDLSGIQFLGSAGLRVLVETHHRCVERGIALRVVAAHRRAVRVLQVTELDRLLELYPTLDAALDTPSQDDDRTIN